MDNYELPAKLFKILMHPARLAILDILRDGEECVCHLEARLSYRQAYISQQLMVMRDAGLVQDRREGWNVYYRVTQPRIFAVLDAAQQAVRQTKESAGRGSFQSRACPCPKCNPVTEAAQC